MTRSDAVELALKGVHRMIGGNVRTCEHHPPDYDGPLAVCTNLQEWLNATDVPGRACVTCLEILHHHPRRWQITCLGR